MFGVYKRYPFPVSIRTKIFNVARYFFTIPLLENFLAKRVSKNGLIKKFTPPIYFFKPGTWRMVTHNGIQYRVDISKLLDYSIYFNQVRDLAWNNLFRIIEPNFNIIDAGANIGYLSLNFAKSCQEGKIFSFEPDSETFESLQTNVQLNNFKNINIYKCALGEAKKSGELFRLYINNPGANRILDRRPEKSISSEVVQIETLDNLDNKIHFERIDLIKIDVEGFEMFVLKGAIELIKRWRPILFLELVDINLREQNCSALEVLKFIKTLDYEILDAQTMRPLDQSQKIFYTDIFCFSKN